MLLSYCITCHKRTQDLLATMPSVIAAANQGLPVEIVVVDYGNQPSLAPLLESMRSLLDQGNSLVIKTYQNRNYYHMSHARNLSLRASSGEFVIISATDILLVPNFFNKVRESLHKSNATYLRSMTTGYVGLLTCRREVLMEMGGWDERFEFYGPEDKDILHRLERKGEKIGYYDLDSMITMIRTPDEKRVANYRLKLSKKEMSSLGREILTENDTTGLVIANEGLNWGEE